MSMLATLISAWCYSLVVNIIPLKGKLNASLTPVILIQNQKALSLISMQNNHSILTCNHTCSSNSKVQLLNTNKNAQRKWKLVRRTSMIRRKECARREDTTEILCLKSMEDGERRAFVVANYTTELENEGAVSQYLCWHKSQSLQARPVKFKF